MTDTYLLFETAMIAKEKGIDEFSNIVYYNTKEHELEDPHHGEIRHYPENLIPRRSSMNALFMYDYVVCKTYPQQILLRILREKFNIHVDVYRNACGWQVNLDKADSGTHICIVEEWNCDNTYEDAMEQGLLAGLLRIESR